MEDQPRRVPLPWSRSCYVCGAENSRGLRLRSYRVGDHIELPFTPDRSLAGWSDVIHGGIIATLLDEVMTWAAILGSERPCYAAELRVRLQRPLRSGTACVAIGRMASARRRIFDTEAWLRDAGGEALAGATGRYMPVPADQLAAFSEDMVFAPGCLDLSHVFGRR
jgi:acyl-coenzyme A thioesterase PaaI-like protein